MAKPYEDTSIFQGWRQWSDEHGDEYRAQYAGWGYWDVYKREGVAFVLDATSVAPKRASCRTIQESIR